VAPEHGYGTRSSTVLLRAANGETQVAERSFAGSPERWSQCSYRWLTTDTLTIDAKAEKTCSAANKIG
jgi:uncharacterized protein with NRDE domain